MDRQRNGKYIREIRRYREWSKKSNKHLIKVPGREEKKKGGEVTFEANNIDISLKGNMKVSYTLKRCWTSLLIREMQIITSRRHYFTPMKLEKLRSPQYYLSENGEQ